MPQAPAVVIVAHGSRREETSAAFLAQVDRVRSRLPEDTAVVAAFLSFGTPGLNDVLPQLAEAGHAQILVLPYFLHDGAHVSGDLPKLLEQMASRYPSSSFRLLPSLEGDIRLEDLLVDRIECEVDCDGEQPWTGDAIEAESHAIINRRLALSRWQEPERNVVRRVIHSTADFSFCETMRISPEAVAAGIAALRARCPVLCDSSILHAGITRTESPILCRIREAEVAAQAKREGTTRAVAAMRMMKEQMHGAIIAIGNAPTALWETMRLAREEGIVPALVVGMPVGFVGARESKTALSRSELCHITNVSMRGGSPAAAAAVNALALLAKETP